MSVSGASFANAANCAASRRTRLPCRSSDQSASWCNFPRSKTTRRASTPFRRSACTFSQGIPAMFTGQCVTRNVRAANGLVELELVEVAQGRSARADARGEAPQLVVRELADRALDAEVRQVQILLVDDRRDARVDLDHVLADELDVEEVLDPELRDDHVADAHQLRVVERLEVHREPGAHRLTRLRVPEHDLAS